MDYKFEVSRSLILSGYAKKNPPFINNGAYLAGYVLELFYKIALAVSRGENKLKGSQDHFHLHYKELKKIKQQLLLNPKLIGVIGMQKILKFGLNQHDVNTFRYDPNFTVKDYFFDATTQSYMKSERIATLESVKELKYLYKEAYKLMTKYSDLFA